MKKNILIFLVILGLAIPTLLPLFKPGFFPTQDFIYIARLYQMDKSLKDGQFPVRWIPDFRYGEPLYNFYAPLPYYVGTFIHTLGFAFIPTVKILFALSFVLSAFAMYIFAKELFGKLGGIFVSTLYLYAPYRSVDIYVRGALSEAWAFIFFPIIFLGALNLTRKVSVKNLLILSLGLAGLFFTHNIMTVLFLPFFLGWVFFLIIREKNIKLLKPFILSILLGFGLAASFLLPAFFEKSFVQTDHLTVGYFDYRGHFVEWRQFFFAPWGYGASLWGNEDGMSFQVGVIHWVVLALVSALVLIRRRRKEVIFLAIFLGLEFLFSLFMQHNKSQPIWTMFSTLAFVQFPWRFLGVSVFFVSLIGGILTLILNDKARFLIYPIVLITVLFNFQFFHPESFYYDSRDEHYISEKVLSQDDKLPKDYLPIWVKYIDKEKKFITPQAKKGSIEVSDFNRRSSSATFNISVTEDADIEIPITYFPGWKVYANNKEVKLEEPSNLGLVRILLPKGSYEVKLNFDNTAIRTAGNTLSLLSLTLLLILILLNRKINKFVASQ